MILWELYDKENMIYIRPEKIEKWENKDINRKKLADRIMKRLTSAEKLTLDNQSVMIKYVKYKSNGTGMKGTSTIMNTDNYCFIYALYLALLYCTNENDFKNASQKIFFSFSNYHCP